MARLRTCKGLSILVALALVFSLGVVAVLMAGTVEARVPPTEVWVDDSGPSCPDTGSGTQEYPYCKIQTGIDNVALRGTVHVYPGNYTENLAINKSLTLQSTDGWQNTTIDPPVQSIIRIEGDANVTVQGFEITAGSYGIYIGEIFSTVNILDCFIHDNAFDGIRVASSGDVLNIERNIISRNGASGGSGIYIQQAWPTVNIRNNYIGAWAGLNSPSSTIGLPGNSGDGIRIDDVPVGSHVTIEDNLIVGNGDDGIDFPSITSVHGSVDIKENVIGAWVYDLDVPYIFGGNHNRGIHVAHVSDTGSIIIEGNAISENWADGINFGSGISAIYGTITILQNFIGGWTCYPGDYGHSGLPQRYQGNGGKGIFIFQVGNTGMVTIEGNKISENALRDADTGIYISNVYGEVSIAGNDVGAWEDSHGGTYLGNMGQGVYIGWVYEGAVLTIGPDNSIRENTDDGIEIYNAHPVGATTITIHHNTIDSNDSDGIELGTPCEVDGATINHNTITNNHEKGIFLTGPSDHNTIINNTIASNDIGIYLQWVDSNYSANNNIISDNEISNNGHGIWVEGYYNQILRNNIRNNMAPISGIHLTSTAVGNIIHCNNIEGNLPYGVYNDNADETVDATNNWWGDPSGPSGVGPGSGDAVSGDVDYSSWLSTEFQYCRECREAPPAAVPTVNHWGIVAMITLFAGLLVWRVRRRRLAS
jgi:parallel beta-helix repeat protein